MKLFKWLQKQYEKTLPYKIIDVTLDELLDYLSGSYPIICSQKQWSEVFAFLKPHVPIHLCRMDEQLFLTCHMLTSFPDAYCRRYHRWLRIVDIKETTYIDDLI